ncbi:MAG: MBOAT family protein [Leptospiraceae bacterium]|nr:MBOAT family protein [Leptospiraceae bacterium]
MLFNSAVFILLFFLVFNLYWLLPLKGKHILIVVTSLIFYAWYSFPFLLLFLTLILFNYALSIVLLRYKSKLLLILGLIVDLGNLFFFKYFYMIAQSVGYLIGNAYLEDLHTNWLNDYNYEITLPIAISFYTFQIVAFLVDSYRGVINERVPFRKYLIFILFFPQFIAGPIMRASDFIAQIDHPTPTKDRMFQGVLLLLLGTVKKVLIADRIGIVIAPIFSNPDQYDAVALVLAPLGFAAQVFTDFSGYTDMARGLSKMLGYEVPENFAGPFLSRSTREFWRRWHITLSSWLRDYIYIPLGGSRAGKWRVHTNLIITMALGGLWHGADWSMLLWGMYIGIDMGIERELDEKGIRILPESTFGNVVRVIWSFFRFYMGLFLFRAPTIVESWEMLEGIFTLQRALPIKNVEGFLGLCILAFLFNIPQYYQGLVAKFRTGPVWRGFDARYAITFMGLIVVGLLVSMYGDVAGNFIYFSF